MWQDAFLLLLGRTARRGMGARGSDAHYEQWTRHAEAYIARLL